MYQAMGENKPFNSPQTNLARYTRFLCKVRVLLFRSIQKIIQYGTIAIINKIL